MRSDKGRVIVKTAKSLLLSALLILVGGAMAPSFAAAGEADFDLQYRLNLNTGPAAEQWNLLQVTVTNRGPEDWQGMVEAVFAGSYAEEVFVPAGKKVEVTFLLPPFRESMFFNSDNRVQLSLKGMDGRVVKTVRVGGGSSREGPLIGVLAASPEMFDRLSTVFPGSAVVHLAENCLDQPLFLNRFSLLVMSDGARPAGSQPERKEHLLRWVEGGGVLVLGGGRGWQDSAALLPGHLLPFHPSAAVERTETLPLKSTHPPAAYLAVTGEVTGRVLLESGGFPLLVAGDCGRGRIFYATLNLEDAPFTDSATLEDFWQQLSRHGGDTIYRRRANTERYMVNEFLQLLLQGGHRPFFFSTGQICAGILFYVALIGPVSFLVLRRLRRWEWAWLSIPALAVFFTAVIYLAAGSDRGSEYTFYQFNLIEMQHENRAAAESYGALFVPRRGSVAFASPVTALAPGKGVAIDRGPAEALQVCLDDPPLWSTSRLYAARPLQTAGPVQMEGSLGPDGITVTVANETGHPFFDSWLCFPEGWQQIGPLESGATKTVTLDRGGPLDLSTVGSHYSGQANFYPHWPEGMFSNPADLLLVGFNDTLPVLELAGTAAAPPLNVFLSGLDLDQLALQESFAIEEGWLEPWVTGSGGMPGIDYHRRTAAHAELYLQGDGRVDLAFALPRGADYAAGEYRLNLGHFNGNGTVEVLVYNRVREEWETLDEFVTGGGTGAMLTLDRMAERVLEGRLLLRLQYRGEMWVEVGRLLSVQNGVRR